MTTAPSLLECQRRFMAALYGREESDGGDWIVGAGLRSEDRLRIYRHSSEQIHTAALRLAYPAVLALVGEAYFEHAAQDYRLAQPARQGNLQGFGAGFGAFLESLPETGSLPYLGDVARLEWLRQEAALARDATPLSAAEFACALSGSNSDMRTVALHPSARLFASAHPVIAIWRYAVQPSPDRLTLPDAGDRILLWRQAGQVVMAAVHDASFACIEALARGHTLDAANHAACALDPDFDLPSSLAGLLENGLIAALNATSVNREFSCSNA